jgi:uncharacterized protein YjbI with pentapeptide repeats
VTKPKGWTLGAVLGAVVQNPSELQKPSAGVTQAATTPLTANRSTLCGQPNLLHRFGGPPRPKSLAVTGRGANLRGANLSRAEFDGIKWDKETRWPGPEAFKDARNLSEALRQQLGL